MVRGVAIVCWLCYVAKMRKGRIGRVDYSNLKNPPEKHERSTATFFTKRGEDVEFICPHSIKGSHNPDFLMHGKIWEIKSPITYSNSSFEYNFRRAMKQSNNIIFDKETYMAEKSDKQSNPGCGGIFKTSLIF